MRLRARAPARLSDRPGSLSGRPRSTMRWGESRWNATLIAPLPIDGCPGSPLVQPKSVQDPKSFDSPNVADYVWSASLGAFELVDEYYDPASYYTPMQPDDVDVTDQFPNSFALGGNDASEPDRSLDAKAPETNCAEDGIPTMPRVTTVGVPPSGGGLVGMRMRMRLLAQAGGIRRLVHVQITPIDLELADYDCPASPTENDILRACAAARAHENGGNVPLNAIYRIHYRDGRARDYKGTGTSTCVDVDWDNDACR